MNKTITKSDITIDEAREIASKASVKVNKQLKSLGVSYRKKFSPADVFKIIECYHEIKNG